MVLPSTFTITASLPSTLTVFATFPMPLAACPLALAGDFRGCCGRVLLDLNENVTFLAFLLLLLRLL